jgi:hypothetical protein
MLFIDGYGKIFSQRFGDLVVKAVDPNLFSLHYLCQAAPRFNKYSMDGIIVGGFLVMTLRGLDVSSLSSRAGGSNKAKPAG